MSHAGQELLGLNNRGGFTFLFVIQASLYQVILEHRPDHQPTTTHFLTYLTQFLMQVLFMTAAIFPDLSWVFLGDLM